MKDKRCPYCGKRISYLSVFASRKKGEITCSRCGKNSKVYVSRKIFIIFLIFALMSLAIMTACVFAKTLNNPFFILLVAVPLLIFMFMTPMFVSYEPFKKYRPSMEARKAGIEYADNLTAEEFEIKESVPVFNPVKKTSIYEKDVLNEPETVVDTDRFSINSDVFNKIKAERNAARIGINTNNSDGATKVIPTAEKKKYVPVIKDVSEDHASTGAGLKKIHSETPHNSVRRTRHYIPEQKNSESGVQKNEKRRTDGNRYSANRKF